jgi:hypothetical protein
LKNIQIVTLLLDSWNLAISPAEAKLWLANDFVFDSGIERFDAEEFIWNCKHTTPWSNIEKLATVDCGDEIMVMFEGIEGVTGLRYRIAWSVCFRESQVFRILHVGAILPPAESDKRTS